MRIDRERARGDYLAMGPRRSLKKLAQRYNEGDAKGGSLSSLFLWSREDGWVERAREHDAQVAGGVSRRAIETQAEETWDAVKELMECVELAMGRLTEALPTLEVRDAAAAKALAETAAILLRLAGEIERSQAPGAQAQQEVDNAEDRMPDTDVIELRRRRHGDGDKKP